ncbi:hypothetical protein ACJMK2_036817 [Sinanodonta woodiana]|uniref:Uncharacterized protein n=1 Tax=Sinanodonta woodiana TaxID=1069815 RepID=A0ABD3WLT8_SINWO
MYVEDTLTKEKHVQELSDHLNFIDPNIQFTLEQEEIWQTIILDMCMHVNEDRSMKITTRYV